MQRKRRRKPAPFPKRSTLPRHLQQINLHAAGIDVGSKSHFVAVPEGCDETPVREFACFTEDLQRLADWLEGCGIETVAMESTGVYWIPVYEILEARGFDVHLINARHVRNVPGRKTDVLDCQWLQQLHTYGLLAGAFRPPEQICALRAYVRQRDTLIRYAASHIKHMQKALNQMNLLLHNVVTDITGVTGMTIIRAIVQGERNPDTLASFRDPRCKNSRKTIAKSLHGNYREEHLFSLQQALELYEVYRRKITDCDRQIERLLARFQDRLDRDAKPCSASGKKPRKRAHQPQFDLHGELIRTTGVDLTRIGGIDTLTALKVISETGLDMQRWPTTKHFTSWLGLCPGNKVSGGKILSSKSKPSANRAAAALRMAAHGLHNAHCALGAFLRRQKARLGPAKAITATAHKLARLIYAMLKHGTEYVDLGQDHYEQQYRDRVMRNLRAKARRLGYEIVPAATESALPVST